MGTDGEGSSAGDDASHCRDCAGSYPHPRAGSRRRLMCGILGSFCVSPQIFSIERALSRLKHRGPDGEGVSWAGDTCHGHVRLALLDLSSASAQPFKTENGNTLSFNGEIWNFREVRTELTARGRTFRTSGDTEVLAQALEEWGWREALPRLEGMFAFAWSSGETHILVRDRFGKVPLYVHKEKTGFLWASERKGLGKAFPATPLPPGSILDLTSGLISRWYRLPKADFQRQEFNLPLVLREGVKARLIADAPLCCLISGGLDSALVLALALKSKRDIVAYTAVLNPRSPDLLAARRLCAERGIKLVEVKVPEPTSESLAIATRAIELTSKAQVEIAALCLPLAQAIASDGFKACLSGEAADELFGGYGSLCIKGYRANDIEWRALRVAQLEKMSRGNFVRCNKAFMSAGVECRLPFMERSLVEGVLSTGRAACPPGKGMLKNAAKGIVPEWVIRRVKETFQGAAGMDKAAARVLADPKKFYRSEAITAFGQSVASV